MLPLPCYHVQAKDKNINRVLFFYTKTVREALDICRRNCCVPQMVTYLSANSPPKQVFHQLIPMVQMSRVEFLQTSTHQEISASPMCKI